MRLAVAGLLLLVGAPILGAQSGDAVRKRPRLEPAADTNDAEAYYRLGHEKVVTDPGAAADAFYWAARLSPRAAHAFYGLHVSLLLESPRRLARYLDDDRSGDESAEIKLVDSLLVRALRINPFLFRKYDHLLLRAYFHRGVMRDPDVIGVPSTAALDREFRQWFVTAPPAIRARVAYCEGRLEDALREYDQAVREAKRKAYLRSQRGRVFYLMGQYDSAVAEFALAIDELRGRDRKELVVAYASKAALEHATGWIHERREDPAAAREAYARALQEDLAFYPAHVSLAFLALQDADTTTALTELELAVQVAEREPMVRLYYGHLLTELRRFADAEAQLVKAIEFEPFYARSYQLLGHVYDVQARHAQAIAQFEAYLARAPLADVPRRSIERRLAELRAPRGGAER